MKKIWVVTYRCCASADSEVFRTYGDAEEFCAEFIFNAMLQSYDGDEEFPDIDILTKWANDNGCCYDEWYFWNGENEAWEANIKEFEL